MATSGSTDFALTRNDIIDQAYGLIGVGVDGETLTAAQQTDASTKLNMLVKTWETAGLHIWQTAEGSFTLTTTTQSYVMGSGGTVTFRPLRILSARFRNSDGQDIPMFRMTRDEYFDLPLKDSTGLPTNFYYDPGLTSGTFYVWPPLATGSSGSVKFTYERTIEDFDAATNAPDFPQEWLETLVYNLAVALAPASRVAVGPNFNLVRQRALELRATLEAWAQEQGSVYLQYDYRGIY